MEEPLKISPLSLDIQTKFPVRFNSLCLLSPCHSSLRERREHVFAGFLRTHQMFGWLFSIFKVDFYDIFLTWHMKCFAFLYLEGICTKSRLQAQFCLAFTPWKWLKLSWICNFLLSSAFLLRKTNEPQNELSSPDKLIYISLTEWLISRWIIAN